MGRLSDASVIPLSTIDPAAPLDDLEPLAHLIRDDVRVVAVGESAHAAHEFYALRHRLIRFFVERMNFTALVWESGFPEAFIVDDYIQSGEHDRERVQVEGMTMHLGRCQEMGDLVDWLRTHNASGSATSGSKPVRFYGLDLPGSSANLEPALDVVAAYVQSVDLGFSTRLARLRELAASFGPGIPTSTMAIAGPTALRQYVALPVADRNELTCLLTDLAARFDALRRSYVERSDAERYDIVRQHLRIAAQLDLQLRAVAALMGGDAAACEPNIRDATMADTVQWVLRRHERIIVLAHNGHIQRTPIATPTGTAESVDTLGVHLADRLGAGYLTIGTTFGGGEIIAMRTTNVDGSYDSELYLRDLPPAGADTIDHAMDSSLSGTGLLDLRTLNPQSALVIDAAHKMQVQDQALDIDVRRAFDALIHVPRISVWNPTVNASLPDERTRDTAGG